VGSGYPSGQYKPFRHFIHIHDKLLSDGKISQKKAKYYPWCLNRRINASEKSNSAVLLYIVISSIAQNNLFSIG
jgi:hypothetical protein